MSGRWSFSVESCLEHVFHTFYCKCLGRIERGVNVLKKLSPQGQQQEKTFPYENKAHIKFSYLIPSSRPGSHFYGHITYYSLI